MKWFDHVVKWTFVVFVALLAGAAAACCCQVYADHPLESSVALGVTIIATYMLVSIALLDGIRDSIRSLREDRQ